MGLFTLFSPFLRNLIPVRLSLCHDNAQLTEQDGSVTSVIRHKLSIILWFFLLFHLLTKFFSSIGLIFYMDLCHDDAQPTKQDGVYGMHNFERFFIINHKLLWNKINECLTMQSI